VYELPGSAPWHSSIFSSVYGKCVYVSVNINTYPCVPYIYALLLLTNLMALLTAISNLYSTLIQGRIGFDVLSPLSNCNR
jgi:hypothetical protein